MFVYELKENESITVEDMELKFIKCDGMYGVFEVLNGKEKGETRYIVCFAKIDNLVKEK